MRTKWFGTAWPQPDMPAEICAHAEDHVDTPENEQCMYCEEPILFCESGVMYPGYIGVEGFVDKPLYAHVECMLRNIMGCSSALNGQPHDHTVPYREDARRVKEWMRNYS